MGGALAALGLLGGCGWDEDGKYFPRRIGLYLRAGQELWWIPEEGQPIQLPYQVRSLSATPWGAAVLEANRDTLYIFAEGGLQPTYTLALGEKCYQVRGFFEGLALCLSCESGVRVAYSKATSFTPQWHWIPHTTGLTQIAVGNSFLIAAGKREVRAYEPQRLGEVARWDIPGELDTLWVEHPIGAGGRWRTASGRPYFFSYLHSARLFKQETTALSILFRQTSPYLKRSVGPEYIGAVSLTLDSVLQPNGHTSVRSFFTDFFSGRVVFLRRDTVWEASLKEPVPLRLLGRFTGAGEIEAVFIYRYGSAVVAIR